MAKVQTGPIEFDVDAREAAVHGESQRVAPMRDDELTESARELSAMIRSVFGVHDNSDIPPIFRTMARTPGLYRCQLEMGRELMLEGKIPPRERELAILRTGWLCRAPFEWSEHVQYGKTCGVTDEEVERITMGSSHPDWAPLDAALIAAVEQLVGDQAIADETWAALAEHWTEEQLMELPVLVGTYFSTALMHNALRIRLLDGSKGLRQR